MEPLRNITDDPRIRLLNRLYAKRRKELKEKEKFKITEAEEMHVDDRSVDDLLSFINGGDEDSKTSKTSKSKKKHRRRKDQSKNSSLVNGVENYKESKSNHSEVSDIRPNPSVRTDLLDLDGVFAGEGSFDDGDDDIDPAIKEQIDREVADFTRRLNLNWSERMRELLYGSRTEVSNCIH